MSLGPVSCCDGRFRQVPVGSPHSEMCSISDITPTGVTTTNYFYYHTTTMDSSDSDDDVLQAVLEFVESFDSGNHQHHQILHHTPAKATATPERPQARKRHSSERIRSEIEALRELSVQLQDRLAHLKFEHVARANASRREQSVLSGWEIEALHQEQQRLQAEMENLQLKGVVEAQAKVARRLEVLFERRVRHEGLDQAMAWGADNQSESPWRDAEMRFTPAAMMTEPPSASHSERATQIVDDSSTTTHN